MSNPKFEVTWSDTPTTRSWYRVNVYEKLDMSMPHTSTLKQAVLGSAALPWPGSLIPGSLSNLLGGELGRWSSKLQDVLDAGGAAAIWLLFHGPQVGCASAPLATRYPRIELSDDVNRFLNLAVHDRDYCVSIITSPIWAA